MKKEYKHIILISCLVIFLVNVPILFFYLFPKDGLFFLGRRVINSQDLYTYLSYIEQSKQGSWLLQNLYTTEPQTGTLVRPSYVLIGKFAHIFNLTSLAAYHVARVFFSIIFCAVLYQFIKKLFDKSDERILAFFIVLTSSGWGVFLYHLFSQSSDLWIPESNTFLSLAESPHFILSQTLILMGILFFFSFLKDKKWKYFFGTFLCLFPIAFEHPFDLLVVVPTLFITTWWITKKIPGKIIISLCVVSTVGLMYAFLQQHFNPLFALEQLQGASISPSPINYLIGFGFLVPLALLGAEKRISSKNPLWKTLIVWIGISMIMVYAPVTFQRRMIEGVHIPIALLASVGVFSLYLKLKKVLGQIANPVLVLFLLLLSATSVYALFTDFATIEKDSKENYYYYVSKSDYDGLLWIRDNTDSHDVILSNWFYGNLIPGVSARKVYIGHKAQTISFSDKVSQINSFILSDDVFSSTTFLHQNNINYIFLGENDSITQYGFKPDEKEYLDKVYEEDGMKIYKVKEQEFVWFTVPPQSTS